MAAFRPPLDASGAPLDNREFYYDSPQHAAQGFTPGRGNLSAEKWLATPTNVVATGGSGTLGVAFDAVTNATRYTVEYTVGSTVAYAIVTTNSASLTSLAAGTYSVRVRAEVNDGMTYSAWSAADTDPVS